jgi:hypothetical protein
VRLISSASAVNLSLRRAVKMTIAPSLAKSLAASAPKPELAPVMKTTLFLSECGMLSSYLKK